MNCNDINLMISEYLDNELTKEKEVLLFTHLSTCHECREEFKQQNTIQQEVKLHQKEVGVSFEERIFSSIRYQKESTTRRWITKQAPAYINYVLGIVIIVITLISFFQFRSIKGDLNYLEVRYENALERILYQTHQINLMMNNMPAIQITTPPADM